MRFRNVPMASFCGFVEVHALVNAERNAREQFRKTEVGGSGVGGICAENDECVDMTARDIPGQLTQRVYVSCRIEFSWLRIEDRFTDVAQAAIDHVGKGMNFRRLDFAGDYDTPPAMIVKVLQERWNPARH